MDFSEYLALLYQKKQTIVSVLILFIIIAVILTFIQPFQYVAQASLLVVRDYTPGVDPYQVSKSNEYVAKVLAKVVNSNSFYNDIINAGFNINRNYFTDDLKEQRKIWRKTVKASVVSDSGVVELSVFHPDKSQADQIIRAINATLKANHTNYHGAGDAIAINVIDQPFTSPYPVKPNIPLNLLLAAMFGLVFGLSYIYLFPDERFNLRLWPFGKKKIKKYNRKSEDFDEDHGSAIEEIEAARAKLRSGWGGQANTAAVNSAFNNVAYGAPDGSYSFYYHKKPGQAGPEQAKYEAADDELGYEEIMKNGRMENVLGG